MRSLRVFRSPSWWLPSAEGTAAAPSSSGCSLLGKSSLAEMLDLMLIIFNTELDKKRGKPTAVQGLGGVLIMHNFAQTRVTPR